MALYLNGVASMKQLFPTDYRDPAEHEQRLENQKLPEEKKEPDYSHIDRLFARLDKMREGKK
jgi:hypothetical protein